MSALLELWDGFRDWRRWAWLGYYDIKLSNRLVMNPLVGKRLHMLMGRLLEEYESRYGALEVAGGAPGAPTDE